MTLVLDASAAIGWLLPDEPNVTILLTTDSILYVPPVFAYEVAHAIQKAVRRDRLTSDQARDALGVLAGFPIQTAPAGPTSAAVFDFAARYEVNAYDAAYLALAWTENFRSPQPTPASPRPPAAWASP